MVDYLIIGQGLAGTLLTHFALKSGKTVKILDKVEPHTPSQIAAGVVNPITGRRYVKSWEYEMLYPFAKDTYATLSQELDIPIFLQKNILRSLFSVKDENDFWGRATNIGYEKYVLDNADAEAYPTVTTAVQGYGELQHCGKVNIALLVRTYRQFLLKRGLLIDGKFNVNQLEVNQKFIQYQEIQARNVIFCEGAKAINNPYFNYLPFNFAKGEVLVIKIPNLDTNKLLKHRLFFIPLDKEIYWIGATYDRTFENEKPTQTGYNYIKEKLDELLTVPYEILEHKAAIRPTTTDRRPFLGRHPKFSNVYIFNGLGAKGASLGPYFANQMINFLEGKESLNKEVNISRYEQLFN